MPKYEAFQNYVTFYSPGTLFPESTSKKIDKWSVQKAIKIADSIKERYDATPYGFQFTKRARTKKDLDSKKVKESKFYFLGGRIMTLEEVKKEMPDERILISNMRNNGYKKIVLNDNSWRVCLPYDEEKHIYLEYSLKKKK